jgi:DNA-3-methyladenine glycosylase
MRRLRRRDLPVDTVALARYLVGKTVVHESTEGRLSGRIVETEAYLPDDAACHAYRGPTPRNGSLFLERGRAYVYIIYGRYTMLNVAGGEKGMGTGVLIRALEPLEGIDIMQRNRAGLRVTELTRGPGRLAQALHITKEHDGTDLCSNQSLWLGSAIRVPGEVGSSVRIGLTVEVHRILRFYERGNRFVSGPRSLSPP